MASPAGPEDEAAAWKTEVGGTRALKACSRSTKRPPSTQARLRIAGHLHHLGRTTPAIKAAYALPFSRQASAKDGPAPAKVRNRAGLSLTSTACVGPEA